jgi:hypothetical protein
MEEGFGESVPEGQGWPNRGAPISGASPAAQAPELQWVLCPTASAHEQRGPACA